MKTIFNLKRKPGKDKKDAGFVDVDVSEFKDEDWDKLAVEYFLTEEFMDLYLDKYNNEREVLYIYQDLSEDFIRRNINRIKMDVACYFNRLSEDFIRDFQDKVRWDYICIRQKLSKELIIEFADKINFLYILSNQKISKEVKDYCRMLL
jgi:hypothetical protein